MSLNHLLNPTGNGLDIVCNKLQYKPAQPSTNSDTVILTLDDVVKQRGQLCSTDVLPIDFIFPDGDTLREALPNDKDFLELTVKYRTSGTVTVKSIDGALFVLFGNSYTLPSSNGINFVSYTIGVSRVNAGGTIRLY